MYSWRREERIGFGRGDTAELGTETFTAWTELEIKLQLHVKAECRRSEVCMVSHAPVAGNDVGMSIRPETLGIVSLATSAPSLEVHFTFYKRFAGLIQSYLLQTEFTQEVCKQLERQKREERGSKAGPRSAYEYMKTHASLLLL